jgi:hypothetical protein
MATEPDQLLSTPRGDLADFSIAIIGGLAFAISILFLCVVPLSGNIAGSRDFVAYWATGQQLIHHADPYEREAVARIEHNAGLDPGAVLLMRNPPWALPLAYALGLLNLRVAAVLWSLLLLACLIVSVLVVRRMHGNPRNYLHWLGLSFSPALICLLMGQTSLLTLLGVVIFLRWNESRPFSAGVALWLCALKPHLLLPFLVAVIFWIVVGRRYRVLAGAIAAMAASLVVTWLMAPAAWTGYFAMMRAPAIKKEFVPCLADAVRIWFWPEAAWLQFLPCALGCVWALIYFGRNRLHWDWLRNGSPLLLVSVLFAPYSYLYDQCLVIPALLDGAYATRSRRLLLALAAAIVAIDIQIAFTKVISPWFLWAAPVWLAWYIFARAASGEAAVCSEAANISSGNLL